MNLRKKHSLPEMLFGNSIIPACVPFYYRLYILGRKACRSAQNRVRSILRGSAPVTDSVVIGQNAVIKLNGRKKPLVNKTCMGIDADLGLDGVKKIVRDIDKLKKLLDDKGLKYTSTAGSFKGKDFVSSKEKNKLWENAWVLASARVKPEDVILDMGGASTIFSFFLAKTGCEVHVVDNDWGNHGIIYNARFVANKMKWNMKMHTKNLAKKLPFSDSYFDKIFSICVLEHLPPRGRRNMMREVGRLLKPGGIAGFTLDYDAGRKDPFTDKGIRYFTKDRLLNDVIAPSGLDIYGNGELVDDCPADFFLGSLFLTKP
ncbi:MAG: class I SAM-dependent methyltransferase [Candidatus Omnitrophica bacterium]|nr:class I SAM-dependent methyltransferase [Candidatus Omnitrophota bacterium]